MVGEIDPAVDFEVMSIASDLFSELGFRGLSLQINSIGCLREGCRPAHLRALVEYFSAYRDRLNEVDRHRLEVNPLRLLDSKEKAAQPLLDGAPRSTDYLCDECREHFQTLLSYLDVAGLAYSVNPRLVRGIDYYTKTVFEVWAEGIGAQAAVCGGGRYDGLVGMFGVEPIPTVGFGMGDVTLQNFLEVHGLLPAIPSETDAYVILIGDDMYERAQYMLRVLRDMGLNVATDATKRKMEKRIKTAEKKGIDHVIFVGSDELKDGRCKLKNLRTGQEDTHSLERIVTIITDHRRRSAIKTTAQLNQDIDIDDVLDDDTDVRIAS